MTRFEVVQVGSCTCSCFCVLCCDVSLTDVTAACWSGRRGGVVICGFFGCVFFVLIYLGLPMRNRTLARSYDGDRISAGWPLAHILCLHTCVSSYCPWDSHTAPTHNNNTNFTQFSLGCHCSLV